MRGSLRYLSRSFMCMLIVVFAVGAATTVLSSVGFAQTRPALVKDVDEPGRSPLRIAAKVTVTSGANLYYGPVGNSIPAGYRFVIEYVSADCENVAGVKVARLFVIPSEKQGASMLVGHSYPILLTDNTPTSYGYVSSIGVQSVRWYHDADSVWASVDLTEKAPPGGISCRIELSGYTINLNQ